MTVRNIRKGIPWDKPITIDVGHYRHDGPRSPITQIVCQVNPVDIKKCGGTGPGIPKGIAMSWDYEKAPKAFSSLDFQFRIIARMLLGLTDVEYNYALVRFVDPATRRTLWRNY